MHPLPARSRHPLDLWQAGDEWTNVATGVRLRVEVAATQTAGQSVVWGVTFPADSPEPPDHYHPRQTEVFTVVSGALRVVLGPQGARELAAGEVLRIGPGQVHRMWNPHAAPAVVRWETSPALRSERWMAMLLALAAAGQTDARGVPRLLQLAVLLQTYRQEIRLCQPPRWFQAVALAPIAAIARGAGYRGDHVKS